MCKYPFSGSLVLLLPLFHRFASLVSFQTHSDLARTHTHTQVYFSSNSRDARLSHSNQHVRKISDSLFGGKKKTQHLPCCLHDQSWSCLVSECSVSEIRPTCHPWCARRISDQGCWLWEFTRALPKANSSFWPISIYLKPIQFMIENSKGTHILVLVVLLITTDFPLGSTLWSIPK